MATIRTQVTQSPQFKPNATPLARAISNALKKSLKDAKQAAAEKIRSRYTIPATRVTRSIRISAQGLSGQMKSQDNKLINLARFLHRPKSRINPQPVVYSEVRRGAGEFLKRAWLKYKPGAIFERTGRKRFPIKRLAGPSPVQLLNSVHVSPFILQKLENSANSNLQKELPPIVSRLVN